MRAKKLSLKQIPWLLLIAVLLAACGQTTSNTPAELTPTAAGTFSNLSASLNPNAAEFRFAYSGSATNFRIDISTYSDMSWDVYGSFGSGSSSPIVVSNPQTRWDKYTCGRTLYWRVVDTTNNAVSQIQTATVCPFPNLSATLNPNAAEFAFDYASAANFRIDMSTVPDMSTDVYVAFGARNASPIVVLDPQARWGKYVCGATLYWRVIDTTNNVSSPIQTATVCPANPFSDLEAALNETLANFAFSYTGSGTSFTVTTSTRPDMIEEPVGDIEGGSSPIKLTNPGATLPNYRCGVVLYWRVTDNLGVSSPIQAKHVCSNVGFSQQKATLTGAQARFDFRYRGNTNHFRIDLSTVADMSTDVYVGFGTGQSSPIVVNNPQARWGKYVCGATLYWRIHEQLNGSSGAIQTAVVECPTSP